MRVRLSDFTRVGANFLNKPWKFSDRGIVAACNGAVLVTRKLRKGDRYEEAPDKARGAFLPTLDSKSRRKPATVESARLKRWAGKGSLGNRLGNCFPLRPCVVAGEFYNQNYLALLMGLIDDKRLQVSEVVYSTGTSLHLVGETWKVVLMALSKKHITMSEDIRRLPKLKLRA